MRIWVNGELRPADDARVSVLDHGLTVGDGVFETLRVSQGRPFAVTRHLRVSRSGQAGLAGSGTAPRGVVVNHQRSALIQSSALRCTAPEPAP